MTDFSKQTIYLSDAGACFDPALTDYLTASKGALSVHVKEAEALKLLIINSASEFSLQIKLDPGASLDYGLMAEGGKNKKIEIQAYCQKNAILEGAHALCSKAELHEQLDVYLQGEGAQMQITGLQYGRDRAVLAHHLCVYHQADHTKSQIEFRGIADGRSRLVFDGLIAVPKEVKGVDANEQTRNLLLSNTAEIHARPRLEIYSNEIACRHGASIGNLDQNALFYLQSRGFSESEARRVLINAFMASIFDQASPIAAQVQHHLRLEHYDH